MSETPLYHFLADLKAAPVVPRPDGEVWAAMVGRISTPGVAAEIDEETFDYFLNVLPPRWIDRGGFTFGEGFDPLRLFWSVGRRRFYCRQLDDREHRTFCRLAAIGLSSG
jgi:hypothetical protein